MEDILKHWPFPYEPRGNQLKAFDWAANEDAKYLLLEAPVGAGKSNIGITVSHALGTRNANCRGDSIILTPQRILQDQYEKSFFGNKKIALASLYGKSNYQCQKKNTTCDIGSLLKPQCEPCPHRNAKKQAQLAADTVLNYKLGLTSFAYTQTFKPRKLMILDECHTLENHLVDFDAVRISEARSKKYNLPFERQDNMSDAIEWLKDKYMLKLGQLVDQLETECEDYLEMPPGSLTRTEVMKIRELVAVQEHWDEVSLMCARTREHIDVHFVLVHDFTQFMFKRLTGSHSFHKYVKPMADRFLFMSSTILNKEGFCRDLGIPEDESSFLSLGSEFDVENRKVFYMPQMKMNAQWNKDENAANRKTMLEAINTLIEMHDTDSGIIHTGNFAIAKWLVDNMSAPRHKLYHHNPGSGDDRNAVIEGFQADPNPSILISPSCTEGLDLKDDLARFAIFAKVPFGFLGDQWIKKRMTMSKEWYQRRALIDIIQGGGRVVRSADDEGTVYILDQSWGFLYNTTYDRIPKWWLDAYQTL